MTLTAEEFEREYAERSRLSVEELRALGRVVRPCSCGEAGCEGWQMISQEAAAEIDDPSKHRGLADARKEPSVSDEKHLPAAVGLCPQDPSEFYMPLDASEANHGPLCPDGHCNRPLVVYHRLRDRNVLVNRIACELDKPSLYMGGPSVSSRRKAERIADLLFGDDPP